MFVKVYFFGPNCLYRCYFGYWGGVKGIMGMPKRFAVFGVGFFRVSGQNEHNLSNTETSLKRTKFFEIAFPKKNLEHSWKKCP